MESVLNSIKKMLGIEAEYTHFDPDIIIHINSTFMTISQLGVGSEVPFITSDLETWEELFEDIKTIPAIKTYVYLKVRILFDPPTSSFVLEALKSQAAELEWRLNAQVDNK